METFFFSFIELLGPNIKLKIKKADFQSHSSEKKMSKNSVLILRIVMRVK